MDWLELVELCRESPDHWMEKRWKLTRLESPSPEFVTAFKELVGKAGAGVHPYFGWSFGAREMLHRIDMLVLDERRRGIRERLVHGDAADTAQRRRPREATPATPPPQGRPKGSLAIPEDRFRAAHDSLAEALGRDPYNWELGVELQRHGEFAVRSAHKRYHARGGE